MNNKELVGLLLTAAEICDEALEHGIGDDLRAAADTLEKSDEGVEELAMRIDTAAIDAARGEV